jgi:hypothetical protein
MILSQNSDYFSLVASTNLYLLFYHGSNCRLGTWYACEDEFVEQEQV